MSDTRQIGRDDYRVVLKKLCSRTDFLQNKQYVHTPYDLCGEMVSALLDVMVSEPLVTPPTELTFLTINLEFVEVLCYDVGVKKANIWFVTDCPQKAKILAHPRYQGVNVVLTDYLSWENNAMKFDVIAGNPPYNAPQDDNGVKRGGGDTLWDKFVVKSMDLLKDKGYLCLVHPMGWRSPVGNYACIKNLLMANNLLSLSVNSAEKGIKVFGAGTAYDYYVCQKSKYGKKTEIQDFDGNKVVVDFTGWQFIPNGMFGEIMSLVAKEGEEKAEVLDSQSAYESRKEWISHEKKNGFKYPVAHGISVEGIPSLIYSNTEKNGMFGIPKVIFGRRTCGTLVDRTGEFACSQHTSAVVDDIGNLDRINKCFQSKEFIKLMSYCNWNSTAPDRYNKNMIALFRKDFWKAFV